MCGQTEARQTAVLLLHSGGTLSQCAVFKSPLHSLALVMHHSALEQEDQITIVIN